jgi:dTDP-4-amino-4,6-dideoxygalactose transaminase
VHHAYYKYYAFLRDGITEQQRNLVLSVAASRGIRAFSGACPEIYREKAFADRSFAPKVRLPNAASLGGASLMFEVHPTLSAGDMERTGALFVDVLKECIGKGRARVE